MSYYDKLILIYMKRIKLSQWAKNNGVSWRTAYRYFKDGKISGVQFDNGTILIDENTEDESKGITVTYARVSSSEQRKTNLEYQSKRLVDYCLANGWTVDQIIKEVGSGLNDKRPKLEKLLNSDEKIERIVIEHKDRLTRFGFNYLEILAKKQNFEIIIINPNEDDKDDLIADFISIITSYCARIYGQRRSKRKTEAIIKELQDNAKD